MPLGKNELLAALAASLASLMRRFCWPALLDLVCFSASSPAWRRHYGSQKQLLHHNTCLSMTPLVQTAYSLVLQHSRMSTEKCSFQPLRCQGLLATPQSPCILTRPRLLQQRRDDSLSPVAAAPTPVPPANPHHTTLRCQHPLLTLCHHRSTPSTCSSTRSPASRPRIADHMQWSELASSRPTPRISRTKATSMLTCGPPTIAV